MTAVSTIADTASTNRGQSDDLDHLYCCDPDLALCGSDLNDVSEDQMVGVLCVVCEDLEWRPCPECGN